jgi:hypothetical protein
MEEEGKDDVKGPTPEHSWQAEGARWAAADLSMAMSLLARRASTHALVVVGE